MAEITKVTTPLIPRENLGSKNKPVSDQAFELTDPSKIHKAADSESQIREQAQDARPSLGDSISREMLAPLTKPANEMSHVIQRIITMLQMGISTSEVTGNQEILKMLESLFVTPEQLAQVVREQDAASGLFKGNAFEVLREIAVKFDDMPKIKEAMAQLLKTFEQNVNTTSSLKTILLTCNNLLDYMFSRDKAQFSEYLKGLSEMLLPSDEAASGEVPKPPSQGQQPQQAGQAPQASTPGQTSQTQAQGSQGAAQSPVQEGHEQQPSPLPGTPMPTQAEQSANRPVQQDTQQLPPGSGEKASNVSNTEVPREGQQNQPAQAPLSQGQPNITQQQPAPVQKQPLALGDQLGVEHKEAAQLLKSNLLPLLGEIVVKYNQNEHIRDMVMVVVHNIVRVDQGITESLMDAVRNLVSELKLVANLPPDFEKNLMDTVLRSSEAAKQVPDSTMAKLTETIAEALSSPSANPATVRQAENLMMSLLQNQNSVMELLHFVLPMDTPQGKLFAEMYVDPDSDERVGRSQEQTRKIFLSVESEGLGNFELCFLASGERVDFSMWCPQVLVKTLGTVKKQVGALMQIHGYTMNSFKVEELTGRQSVANVFPRLMNRRMGVDVRI